MSVITEFFVFYIFNCIICTKFNILRSDTPSISISSSDQWPQDTAQKTKFYIKGFFSKCDQIRSFQRIWSQ